MVLRRLGGVCVLVVVLAPCGPAAAASFQGLGYVQGLEPTSSVYGISADGTTVVGKVGGREGRPFRWTAETGMVALGNPTAEDHAVACAVSADGSVVAGGRPAFRWTAETGFVRLATIAASSAVGISADGSVIVGQAHVPVHSGFWRDEPLAWIDNTEYFLPGLSPRDAWDAEEEDGFATGVSADGRVIVGTIGYGDSDTQSRMVMWVDKGPPVYLSGLNYFTQCISADGSVVIGQHDAAVAVARWSAETGLIHLPDPPGGNSARAYDVSGDGQIVVGSAWSTIDWRSRAVIWKGLDEARWLEDVLVNDYGLDLGGWRLGSAEAISDDGRLIAGGARISATQFQAWIAVIPEPTSLVLLLVALCCLLAFPLRRHLAA